MRDLRARGISILITDHQVRETLEITDRSYVVRSGQVLCHGTRDEVLQNEEARKYYFGDSMDSDRLAPHSRQEGRLASIRGRLTGHRPRVDEDAA